LGGQAVVWFRTSGGLGEQVVVWIDHGAQI
jgi:hypothetical protein